MNTDDKASVLIQIVTIRAVTGVATLSRTDLISVLLNAVTDHAFPVCTRWPQKLDISHTLVYYFLMLYDVTLRCNVVVTLTSNQVCLELIRLGFNGLTSTEVRLVKINLMRYISC